MLPTRQNRIKTPPFLRTPLLSARALSYLTDSPSCIKLIISTGAIITSLIRLLSVGDMNIQVPALRALGNVAMARA
ncbi:hypothetical protein Pelo_19893 [Pelomyxa schiedti]|nr:hypothetical protein Pelo_19893 [Pelomyxa schiedti]